MSTTKRSAALAFVLLHLFQICYYPGEAQAQGGGNDQAGAVSSLGELVNLATGDFQYSIPLLNVEGYPITLNYQAGIQLNQEASWVGLGWSLTPGAVQRQMRGIPDDFKGDPIQSQFNQKTNLTRGGGANAGVELGGFGDSPFGAGLGVGLGFSSFYNTYTGFGFETSKSLSAWVGAKMLDGRVAGTVGFNLNNSVGNQSGVTESSGVSVGLSGSFAGESKGDGPGARIGYGRSNNYNSIRGTTVESQSVSASLQYRAYDSKIGRSGTGDGLLGIASTTSSFPSSGISFLPKINFPRVSSAGGYKISGGGEFYGTYPYGGYNVFYMEDRIMQKKIANPAFGTLFLHEMDDLAPIAIKDFNREAEKMLRESTTMLPYSYVTPDYFSASAAGMACMFKTKRGDVGTVSDNNTFTSGFQDDKELEFGVGVYAEAGTNFSTSRTRGASGAWQEYFGLTDLLAYRSTVSGQPDFEPYYFKKAGELTKVTDLYEAFGGEKAAAFKLQKQTEVDYSPTAELVGGDNSGTVLNSNHNAQREVRNTVIYGLNARDASRAGLQKQIETYTANNFNFNSNGYTRTTLERVAHAGAKNHHLSEIHITGEQGERYVYGVPVYTRQHVQKTFNINGRSYNIGTGLTNYVPGQDNTLDNERGTDDYFQGKIVPEYAETFLLSASLAPDYEDVTQNGPTPDDIGHYTKFNYARHATNYQYRFPFQEDSAFYDPGMYADPQDDKGSYLYGQKEVWYLHSIETKNYFAEFELNDPGTEARLDGVGANDENGGIGLSSTRLRYLKEIRLYHRSDKLENGSNAQPLQTIRFEYDYSLAHSVPDNSAGSGRLTLKSVEIIDHRSQENENKRFTFTYGYNPAYQTNAKDRWGCYKPQVNATYGINSAAYRQASILTNMEYPYAVQNKDSADLYAAAWNLSKIETPQGSELEVFYESDDYAYVQDQRAMRMYQVKGFLLGSSIVDQLYAGSQPNLYMVVDLAEEAIPASDPTPQRTLRTRLMADLQSSRGAMEHMFYRIYTQAKDGTSIHYESIPGYAQIQPALAQAFKSGGGDFDRALIPMQPEITDGLVVNPVSRMAWQVGGDYLSRYIVDGSNLEGQGIGLMTMIQAIEGQQEQKRINRQGFFPYMRSDNNGNRFIDHRSFVRLYDRDGVKMGGGHRVKRILVKDRWEEFSDVYGVEYTYTKEENNRTISSGVAANEPSAGGDENALRMNRDELLSSYPGAYGRQTLEFVEFPFGQNVYPNPQVVYSRVESKSIQKGGVTLSRTGSTVHEYFTARDFPTRYSVTPIEKYFRQPEPKVNFFNASNIAVFTCSQGMSVVLNDMHGKPKKIEALDENGQRISSVEYIYRTNTRGRLDNVVPVVNDQGSVQNQEVGIDVELTIDTKEVTQKTSTEQPQRSINVIPAPSFLPFPFPIPSWFDFLSEDERIMRSITLCKVVQQYGILEKTITRDERSEAFSETYVYDQTTGFPRVSGANNFLNPAKNYVSYSYPAYWHSDYTRMGPAYPKIGRQAGDALINVSDEVTDTDFQVIGTEVLALGSNGAQNDDKKLWVSYQASTAKYHLIDAEGALFSPLAGYEYTYTILRPGEANYLHTNVQNLTLMRNSGTNHGSVYQATSLTDALQASAVEFRDQARVYGVLDQDVSCADEGGEVINDTTDVVNPYVRGIRANWSQESAYAYRTPRAYDGFASTSLGTIDLADDGFFTAAPLYYCTGGGLVRDASPAGEWVETSRTQSVVNQNNQTLETQDIVGVHHSVSTNWNSTNLHAQVSTSKKREHYFEDFEDAELLDSYFFNGSYYRNDLHYNNLVYRNGRWTERIEFPDTNQAHTGHHSLRLVPGGFNGIAVETPHELGRRSASTMTVPYRLKAEDLELGFYLTPADSGRTFTISFWVHREGYVRPYEASGLLAYSDGCASTKLILDANNQPLKIYESPVIDGWKQVQYRWTVPKLSLSNGVTIQFQNNYAENIYLDDIRIHPEEAHMVSSVVKTEYGWQDAVLDENNFSVQYEYDSKGRVFAVIRETERGRQTISTTRQSLED